VAPESPGYNFSRMDYQQLRKMDLEQLKTSMYDAEPGSPWFEACLTEVNIRNANQMTATLVDMSQAMKEMKTYTAALDTSSRQTVEAMTETVHVSKSIKKSSKLSVTGNAGLRENPINGCDSGTSACRTERLTRCSAG
jgi:hypothetical protein